jgi:RNA polymerase sigma-70 factor (ECF subfamily)
VLLEDPTSPGAWERFVSRYGPRIFAWCRKWKLQEADAEDVTQQVLVKLYQHMQNFNYDPSKGSFRGWLKTVTHNAWADYHDSRRRAPQGHGDNRGLAVLGEAEAHADLVEELNEAFDRELLELAKRKVQLRVSARDWQIFIDLTLGDCSGKEVAEKLGMTVTAVFMAKCRVQKKLEQEVRRLYGRDD